jgi:hypothetical protein
MYIKFLKHGKGDPAKAASYLIDEVDHLNRPRPDVQVLRGDPHTFTAIAESIQNEWKYTSGVIAWSKDDAPQNDEIDQVLEAFEKHAFSGLKPNQYHFTAVLHEEDDGSKHVHFLVPRVELDTGKALNIAPPGHEKYFDPLRDYFNYSKGWSRPDDPALKRDTQTPDHIHFQDKSAVRAGLKGKTREDIREVIGSYIEQRVEYRVIRNRKDVLDAISELGQAKPSENYISFKFDGADKAIRLKGAFYESDFNIESYFEDRARKENDARASGEYRVVSPEHRQLAEQCRTKFEKLANKRATYNGERYQSDGRSQVEPNFSPKRESELISIVTTPDERNSQSFEPTGTAAPAAKKPIRSIEQHEPRDSRNSQNQENPFYIKYGFSFDSSYFAYIEHQSRLRQQEQIQRHKRDAEQSRIPEIRRGEHEYSEVWNREALELVRPNRPNQADLQEQLRSSAGNQLNESRSTIIADYRTATTAARASLAAYSDPESNHRRIREIQQRTGEALQSVERARQRVDQYHQAATESEAIRRFIEKLGEQLKTAIREPFRAISHWIEHRKSSKGVDQENLAKYSGGRDQKPIEAHDRESHQENEFSRAISTRSSAINSTDIFKALDQLDQRRELQQAQEQAKKNDRGYDSPSLF